MPTPRSLSIVTCSCGWRLGNYQRAAAHEDMEAAEAALINNEAPRMVRHWMLGHELTVNERAPIWVKAVIARAAAVLTQPTAGSRGEPSDRGGGGPPMPGQQPHRRLPDDDDS